MPREMRRKERALEAAAAEDILVNGEYGVLSTVDQNGQPYGVPLNYVYSDGKILLHSAREGHKLDNLKHNPQVSFCVVGQARIIPDQFSTDYQSVIVSGQAKILDGTDKKNALLLFVEKYSSGFLEEGKDFIQKVKDHTTLVCIEVEHISGKARKK